jgi:hypothetical protein
MSESPTAPTPFEVCARRADQVSWFGEPCPECGHTTAAHAGAGNPALDECVLCRVQVSVDDLVALAGGLESGLEVVSTLLGQVSERVAVLEVARPILEDRVGVLEALAHSTEAGA